MGLLNFKYYKTITIDSSKIDDTLTNFPVLVTLDSSNFSRGSEIRADGYDIKFTNTSDTLLDFERVRWTNENLGTNLNAHYLLNDDAANTTVADNSGNGYTGTLQGGDNTQDLSTTGKINDCFDFNGTDDYVDCGTGSGIALGDGVTALSVSAWFKADSFNEFGIFYFGSFSNDHGEFAARFNSGSLNHIRIAGQTYDTDLHLADTSGWHHIVVTYDGSTGKVYLDGALGYTCSKSDSLDLSGLKFIIGAYYSSSYTADGKIDDVRVYSETLSNNKIAAIYQHGRGTESKTTEYFGEFYVEVPSVASGSDTDFRMWYVNSQATDSSSGSDTFSAYAQVHHLNDNAASTTITASVGDNGTWNHNTNLHSGESPLGGSIASNDGTDQAKMGNVTNYEYTDAFTVSGWMYRIKSGTDFVFAKYAPTTGWAAQWWSDDKMYWSFNNTAIRRITNADSEVCIWNHWLFSYDGSGNRSGLKIYKNGAQVDTTDGGNATIGSTIRNTDEYTINGYDGGDIGYYVFAHVTVAGSDNSGAWAKAEYNSGNNSLVSFGSEESQTIYDTPWGDGDADKLFLASGQFSTTLKDSQDTSGISASGPWGVEYDGSNTVWMNGGEEFYLQSGLFSATVKSSDDFTAIDDNGRGCGAMAAGGNTPWGGREADKLYLNSGQFEATIKTSTGINGIDSKVCDCSWDGTNTPWSGESDDKLYLASGQFETTLKDSLSVGGVDDQTRGISYDGTNTPWSGIAANKLYLQSGQFESTMKTSLANPGGTPQPMSISTENYEGRLGITPTSATISRRVMMVT